MAAPLKALGVFTATNYVEIALLSWQFHEESHPAQWPILAVLTISAIACLAYPMSLTLIARNAGASRRTSDGRADVGPLAFRDVLWVWFEHGIVLIALAGESSVRRGARYFGALGDGGLSGSIGASAGASDG